MPPQLGYWNIRGFGEFIRKVLAYVGEDYDNKMYRFTDQEEWLKDKEKMQQEMEPLANLPYYRDGDIVIVQTMAILRHLGRKYALAGTCEKDYLRIDMLLSEADDIRTRCCRVCYQDISHGGPSEHVEWMQTEMKKINNSLADKTWFLGDKISIVDFVIHEILDWHRVIKEVSPGAEAWANAPNITAFMNRFEALPEMQKYFSCEETKKLFIMANIANYGGENPKP